MAVKQQAELLPDLPDDAPGIPPEGRYKPQFGVILVCPDEGAQRALYDALQALRTTRIKVVVT
jgi:hypothetical protein